MLQGLLRGQIRDATPCFGVTPQWEPDDLNRLRPASPMGNVRAAGNSSGPTWMLCRRLLLIRLRRPRRTGKHRQRYRPASRARRTPTFHGARGHARSHLQGSSDVELSSATGAGYAFRFADI